jgi:uncharacterized protein (TIGR00255 family)
MLSMTGFGAGSVRVGAATVVIEARAVNHRFLDVRVRLPSALADHAGAVEDVARGELTRGRIELGGRFEGRLSGEVVLDRERARTALRELQELQVELRRSEPLPLSLLGVVPGLFVEHAAVAPDEVRAALQEATRAACRALGAMRGKEGEALARDFDARLQRVSQIAGRVEQRLPELSAAHRERLRARLSALLEGTAVALDPGRLEHEVALQADRSDVSEELTRLHSHCQQFAALIAPQTAGDEPIGRRLEFLLQEMGREVNTLGSKVSDLQVTGCVLDLKAELERMREQVQNVL